VYAQDDTIAALSSAPTAAARAIIRLSGPDALMITDVFFQSDTPVVHAPPWSVLKGRWSLQDDITVPVNIYAFPAPRSYTTEDMAEIHLPGSPPLTQMILDQLITRGARMAEPGEFTARAFLNGRIDLTQAEAVAQIINARSDDQLRAASRLLDGKFHQQSQNITEQIAELLALIEADIDFSDDEIEFASPEQIAQHLRSSQANLKTLLDDALSWDKLSHLPQVVLAGLANAGKSTLANALLKTNRAIISDTPGTTRDLLTAPLTLDQGQCLLIDTAGLGEVQDILAEQTQHLARQAVQNCDLLIFVLDSSQKDFRKELDCFQQLPASLQKVVAANKTDLNPTAHRTNDLQSLFKCPLIPISAAKNKNLDILKQHIQTQLQFNPSSTAAQTIALTTRQHQALLETRNALQNAQELLTQSNNSHPEFLAIHLREALDHLGAISGKVLPNDILTIIFKKFCIGK
jgi:tRNA modification GTPase